MSDTKESPKVTGCGDTLSLDVGYLPDSCLSMGEDGSLTLSVSLDQLNAMQTMELSDADPGL